jgi:5'-3' exonuclease
MRIDVEAMRTELARQCGVSTDDVAGVRRVVRDYVFLVLMLGSDFTPSLRQFDFGVHSERALRSLSHAP